MKRLSFLLNKKIMIGIAAVIIFIYFTIQVYAETPTDMGEPQNESELFLLQDISDIVPNIDDRDAVYGQYVSMLFGGESDDNIFLDEEVYRGNLLLDDPFDRESYKIVTNEVKMIANGDKIETNVQIDIDELIGEVDGEKYASFGYTLNELGFVDGENPTDEDIIERIKEKSFPDIHLVYKALYEDRGDLLYWSHGAMIGTYNGVLNKCEQNGETRYKLDGAYKKIFFKVFPYYMISGSTNQFMVDTNKTGAAVRALNNAKAIINEAENGLYDTDYKKICFFRDKICELNSYNFDAVSSEWDKSDMNPWKIIYVFDEDPLTNVVCDGYARAFKYLVENTEFDSDYINCDTVTGDLIQYQNDNLVSKGAHKWCIIRMDDGQRYFVDITGCDSGDSNSSDLKSLFFLNGVNNITEDRKYKGYSVSKWGYTYEYLYEDSTYELYNDEELIVSETSYEPSAYIAPTQKNSITSASIQEIPEMTFKPNEEIRPIVTILYNGEKINFVRNAPQNNKYFANNKGKFFPKAFETPADFNKVYEDIVLNHIISDLNETCKEFNPAFVNNYIVNYISYVETELKKISINIITRDVNKDIEEQKKEFIDKCNEVVQQIEKTIESKMNINKEEVNTVSKNESTDVSMEDIISKLTAEELILMDERCKQNPELSQLDAAKEILKERNEVIDIHKDIQAEKNKVKVLELTKPRSEAAFVDFITLSLISTLTVMLTVVWTLQIIK